MELVDFGDICYQLDNVEGIDNYCKYMGFGPKKQEKIVKKNQYAYLKHGCCGCGFYLIEEIGFFKYEISVSPNPSFREYSWDNGCSRSSMQISNNKIIHTQNGRKQIVTVREFSEDAMRTIITVDKSVVLIKYYVRVDK